MPSSHKLGHDHMSLLVKSESDDVFVDVSDEEDWYEDDDDDNDDSVVENPSEDIIESPPRDA